MSYSIDTRNSIKAGTRSFRKGSGSKRPVRQIVNDTDVPLPNNWKQFLELAMLLSEDLSSKVAHRDIVTAGGFKNSETVKCSPESEPGILSATHEEADTLPYSASCHRRTVARIRARCNCM